MYTESHLKDRLKELCQSDPYIHIDVSLTKPHVELKNECVKLLGAYKHIFQIERDFGGRVERWSIQYGDVISGIVKIYEL